MTLRPFGEADIPAIAAACSDSEIARFTTEVPQPYTEADALAYVAYAEQEWATAGSGPWPSRMLALRAFLGAIEVRLGAEGSIGFWVAPAARGRGVATRASGCSRVGR